MTAYPDDFTDIRILDSRSDADSPITEALVQDLIGNTQHNHALIRSDGSALMAGTIGTVSNAANSIVYASSTVTAGSITNSKANMYLEVTNGSAAGTLAKITTVTAGSNNVTVNTNLVTAGAANGDAFRVIFGFAADYAHTHDGTDSRADVGAYQYVETQTLSATATSIKFGTAPATVNLAGETDGIYKLVGRVRPNAGNTRITIRPNQTAANQVTVNDHRLSTTNSRRQVSTLEVAYQDDNANTVIFFECIFFAKHTSGGDASPRLMVSNYSHTDAGAAVPGGGTSFGQWQDSATSITSLEIVASSTGGTTNFLTGSEAILYKLQQT